MKPLPSLARRLVLATSIVLTASELPAVTWTNGTSSGTWSAAGNWDTGEPVSTSDVVFPFGLAGAITLSSGENARTLQFSDDYTLTGGTLTMAPTTAAIETDAGITASISTPITITSGGLTKNGAGTLVLSGSNTSLSGGVIVNSGTLRVANANAAGGSAGFVTLAGGTTLDIAGGITFARAVTYADGAVLSTDGTASATGIQTIGGGAAGVTFATTNPSDVLTVGDTANDLTGGSASTVLSVSGPGAIRLGAASNFPGSWTIHSGRLELANATAAGSSTSSSITLAGGSLSARTGSATNFTTSPANQLIVTANSSLVSDRTSASAGLTHTFGTLAIGTHTLTVSPGANATSGTAGITVGNLTLSGNPSFSIDDAGATNGKLTTGSLIGGGTPRSITKTGAGDLAITGGSTDLPAGSTFSAGGGGNFEMIFPSLGTAADVVVTAAQNPLGQATASITDGMLRLLAVGNGASTAQTYTVDTSLSLAGNITLDPDRLSGSGSNKTYVLPIVTLAAGTTLNMAGDFAHGVRVSGVLSLSGSATLQGTSLSGKDGLLTLDGGITGGPAHALTIAGGTSPLNLTLNAAATYGGGTTITGGTTTVNATGALGTGGLTMSGGTLTINSGAPFGGNADITGGTIRVNVTDALAGNNISVNGGTLDFRANATSGVTTGAITLSGAATLSVGNNGSGSSQTLTLPPLNISGNTTLTLSNANSFIPDLSEIVLAGDLTVSNAITARIQEINEDASPRRLIKTGTGTLHLDAASSHSGGTEVLAGTLQINHAAALGTGTLVLGDSAGAANATAAFASGVTIANPIETRAGGTGTLTLDAPSGGVTWNGTLTLGRELSIDNGSTTADCVFNGQITGTGAITKLSSGEIVLGNASNNHTGDLTVSNGMITIATDGALGNPANDVYLTGSSAKLKVDGTFSTSRTISFGGTSSGVDVTTGQTFTLNAALAGSGTFVKGDAGTLVVAPGVDSSGRGSATTTITGGVLRIHQPNALSAAGTIQMNSSSGTLELLADANTDFAHPLTANGTGPVIHVGPAPSGSTTNGRHRLGDTSATGGVLTVTGDNGYGLTLGNFTTTGSNTIANDAPGTLELTSLTGVPGASNRTITFDGTGDIEILGTTTQGAGTGNYAITKNGSGTVRFGTSLTGFTQNTNIRQGTVDLNGLNHAPVSLSFAGPTSTGGAHLMTGAGLLTLVNGLAYNVNFFASPVTSNLTGNVDLGSAAQNCNIANSGGTDVELVIDGPISGSPGCSLVKSGTGTLRLAGTGNTHPGITSATAGLLELAKSSGNAVTVGGLDLTGGTVRLLASDQIHDSAPVSLNSANNLFLELNGFTDTIGPLSITQTDPFDYSAVKTGAAGTLTLNGNVVLSNNGDHSTDHSRAVLITGTGTDFVPANDGTLDLGGAMRTIEVTTSVAGSNAQYSNATIETRIINGGILKTGPRTLYLTHPGNTISGGIQVSEGAVNLGNFGTVTAGGVSIASTGAGEAVFELGDGAGTFTSDITIGGGGGTNILRYAGLAPNIATLSGNINLGGDLAFDVVHGSTTEASNATLDVTGLIDDGAGTFSITKTGDGMLQLAAGNTFGGTTTVNRGTLGIAAASSLGDATSAALIDGGCLEAMSTMSLTRDVTFGPGGGSLKADTGVTLEIPGTLTWSTATASFFGAGQTVLSGVTSGSGGYLVIGSPTAFADNTGAADHGRGHVLSLRGTATLPAGNLNLVDNGVLELGTGDFTLPLGTGPGEVQLSTAVGGGWAAHGADRVVNLGGAGATLTWGQPSPPFLFKSVPGNDFGDLVLGSATATHTVDFRNPLELNSGGTSFIRTIRTNNGPAALDARISGNITQSADPAATFTYLVLEGAGSLDISGDITGEIGIEKLDPGTCTLSGTNGFHSWIEVYEGTLEIASDASLGSPSDLYIDPSGTLDASALTNPVSVDPLDGYLGVYGTLHGDVNGTAWLEGNGVIHGDVTTSAITGFYPALDGTLLINGDFILTAGSYFDLLIAGSTPETEYNRASVAGTVTLAGDLFLSASSDVPTGFTGTFVILLNDGTDAVNGTFNGLPEGALIPIGGGLALQITYTANGDGGAVGNDVGLTVVPDTGGNDLALASDAPLVAGSGAAITVDFTVTNNGPGDVTDGILSVEIPANATLTGSTPAGTLTGTTLAISLPAIASGNQTGASVNLAAPAAPAAVDVQASVTGSGTDPNPADNSTREVVAVLENETLTLSEFSSGANSLGMTIDTLDGVTYVFESSPDLENWEILSTFVGDGLPHVESPVFDETREFFRFRIVPTGFQPPVN